MKLLQLCHFLVAAASTVAAFPSDPLRVLQISDDEVITVRESQKWELRKEGVTFFDITKYYNPFKSLLGKGVFNAKEAEVEIEVAKYNYPTEANHTEVVSELIKDIKTENLYRNLAKFTSFHTRYYKSESGFEAAEWLSSQIHNLTDRLPKDIMASVRHFDHKEWRQFSIIVSIPGSIDPDTIVVVGSHLDCTNFLLPNLLAAPGADDNGSGTVTNLEALRIIVEYLLKTGKPLRNTIEFHFYSAEEAGLLGSQDVFSEYRREGKHVVAMLQQDMTGYVDDESLEVIGVITDYTSTGLTNFVKLMIDTYLEIPYVETACGYACSDHASAMKNGFPAAFVIEDDFKRVNKYIHSTMDTLDRLSFTHMAEYCKLSIGLAIELGEYGNFSEGK